MIDNDFEQLGGIPGKNGLVLTAGQPVGTGLSKEAAQELGLEPGCAVGSGVIDAYGLFMRRKLVLTHRYAGWIGTVAAGTISEDGKVTDIPAFEHSGTRLAAIAGTSTCHIAQSKDGILVPGSAESLPIRIRTDDQCVGTLPQRSLPRMVDERRRTILHWAAHRLRHDDPSCLSQAPRAVQTDRQERVRTARRTP